MEAAGSAVDAEALCTPVKRLLRPAGSTQQVASMLALLRTGRLEDALVGCKQLVDFACASKMQETACDGREVAGAAGALAAVVRAMHAHTQLQAFGCLALVHLCSGHARNRVRAVATGAIDAVLTAIALLGTNTHADDVTVLPLLALRSLIEKQDDYIAAAIAAGAIDRVVTSVCAYLASVPLQSTGWYCLRTLIRADAAAARVRAIDVGAIDAVLAMMEMHAGQCGLSADGCCALRGLYNELADVDSPHARALADSAVAAVLRVLDAHRGDIHVQHEGCFALRAIWDTDRTQHAAVAASTAVPSVLAALRAHPGSECVQEGGLAALVKVCSGPDGEANAVAAAAAGAVPLVLAAMGTYFENQYVQSDGCLAFSQLRIRDAAQQARMAEAVVCAMGAYVSSLTVQFNGSGALATIAAGSAASLALTRAAGAVEAVVGALHGIQRGSLADSDVLIKHCASTLIELVDSSAAGDVRAAAAQDAAVRAGALECSPDLMQRLSRVPDADQRTVAALETALAPAARRHDAAPCAHAAACKRCAAFRARGNMCALPSCGARRRTDAGDAKKKLLRCARCETATYCCKAHQTADWAPRHKAECRKPLEGGGGASGSAQA